MTPTEIRKLADHYEAHAIAGGMVEGANRTIATALRHYADSLEKRDKVEAIIEAGEQCATFALDENHTRLFSAFDEAVAEYRKDNK